MTEYTEEEQLVILEILYSLKMNDIARVLVGEQMDLSDEELFKVLDKAEKILAEQAKQNPN
jgi:hypothetical protein